MCLAKAFVNNWSGQPAFQNIARMRVNGNRVELEYQGKFYARRLPVRCNDRRV